MNQFLNNEYMKIALLNLPIPEPIKKYQRGNHLLFADYFESLLYKNNNHGIEIINLSRDIIDGYNNQAIVDEIIKQAPDIVGFSSYIWNTERNQQISLKLKQFGIITITGGPEVHEDNQDLLNNNSFDYFVKGEGEYILFDLIADIIKGENLKKKFLINSNNVDFNDFISEYGSTTNQYLSDKLFYLELERGCPYKCDYCSYGKFRDSIISIDMDLYKNILDNIYNKDIEEIYLLSPTLNRKKKRFKAYLDYLIKLKRKFKKNIKIFGEIRPEFIDIDDIKLMHQAGFKEIEFGIQSLSTEILRSIKRNFNLKDLVEFSHQLLDYDILPMIDFIIGLPGDSYENIINSIEKLDKKRLLQYCNFYHLQILPGTKFREKFIKNKFGFLNKPPYFVLNTDKLNLNQIKKIYLHLENNKDISYREDLIIENAEQFYLIKNKEDLFALEQTKFYQTGSLVFFDDLDYYDILSFFDSFFKKNPEIFHKIFLYSKFIIEESFFNKLNQIILKYKNYYDLYKESINYFNNDFFSKSYEILISPDKLNMNKTDKLIDDYFINFIIFPEEINILNRKFDLLIEYFNKYSINTYLFKENKDIKSNFIKYFPIYFDRKIFY